MIIFIIRTQVLTVYLVEFLLVIEVIGTKDYDSFDEP
jgi:hypothetical protein